MGRIAPIFLLLALAACSSSRYATTPPAMPTPVQATAPVPQPPPTPQGGSSVQEVNELFRWLDAQPAAGTTASRTSGAGTVAQPAVIYTIPRADPVMLAIVDREAQQTAYQENLEGCLDGRFPAFCDHGALDAHDAARVREAEYQANLATCIDPQWQYLCRADLATGTIAPATSPPGPGRALPSGLDGASAARPVAPSAAPVHRVVPSRVAVASPTPTPDPVAPAVPSHRFVTAAPSPPDGMIPPPQPARASRPPAPSLPATRVQAVGWSDSEVTERIIRTSIMGYPGRCPCPYFVDRAGRQCGRRSAYSRGGGYGPICYREDVTPDMIEDYRRQHSG